MTAPETLSGLAERAAEKCEEQATHLFEIMAKWETSRFDLPGMTDEALRLLDCAASIRARAAQGEGR